MDNGTMVETFKFLNYYQLATNSLVSKRFWNLIRTHRHKLALLDVNEIFMDSYVANQDPAVIKMFNEELSPEEYNEWIVRNGYSKQVPLEGQIAGKESTENGRDIYEFWANVSQSVELNDETWPLFQHFIRLLVDPFIYIRSLLLYSLTGVFTLLAGAINSDLNRGRLQCEKLNIYFNGDTQKFIVWIKDHVRCDEFQIYLDRGSNNDYDEELSDFFLTGASCTSTINVIEYDLSKVIVDLVQITSLVEPPRGSKLERPLPRACGPRSASPDLAALGAAQPGEAIYLYGSLYKRLKDFGRTENLRW
ncbi:hypothetical protein Ddc_24094 [Ditylenchus destructor]|nr:hypothetical protein Ddc_24094 [Ditylenchus destructor]